jgi:hypothetical protein
MTNRPRKKLQKRQPHSSMPLIDDRIRLQRGKVSITGQRCLNSNRLKTFSSQESLKYADQKARVDELKYTISKTSNTAYTLDKEVSNDADFGLRQCHTRLSPPGLLKLRQYSKTPVTAIGQLEEKTNVCPLLPDTDFQAKEYISLLPNIADTDIYDKRSSNFCPMKSLRRIESEDNLRSTERSSTINGPGGSEYSISTLEKYRADSPPHFGETFDNLKCHEMPQNFKPEDKSYMISQLQSSQESSYLGMQICLRLLTKELTEAICCQHPEDIFGEAAASKLQIILLINAYEGLLAKCRLGLLTNTMNGSHHADFLSSIRLLNHWLNVLYTLYENECE